MVDKGKESLLDILLSMPNARYNLAKTEIMCRCPYCSGSRTDRNDASFCVKVPEEGSTDRWLYICYRANCRQKGYISPEFLRMVGHNSFESSVYLNKVNRASAKDKKYKSKHKRVMANFPTASNKLTLAKLAYINNRLGLDLSINDLVPLKIHLDFEELYKLNEIKFPVKKSYYYSGLSKAGISFISAYNDYLIVRNATDNEKFKRYTNIDIFETDTSKDEDRLKFYVIPTKIDTLANDPVVLNMAEGTFDILSVYFNLNIDSEYDNQIFISVSGASYLNTIIHFIRQYGLVDLRINIFSDNGIDLSYYESISAEVLKYLNSLKMFVYYNTYLEDGVKDFGVDISRINIQKNKIL